MLFLNGIIMEIKYFNDADTLLLIFNTNPIAAAEDIVKICY